MILMLFIFLLMLSQKTYNFWVPGTIPPPNTARLIEGQFNTRQELKMLLRGGDGSGVDEARHNGVFNWVFVFLLYCIMNAAGLRGNAIRGRKEICLLLRENGSWVDEGSVCLGLVCTVICFCFFAVLDTDFIK